MAISYRELYLMVRAQNQASAALRRVGADVAALGRSRALAVRGAQLRVQQQTLLRQRAIAKNELASIENGRRALGLQRRQLSGQLAVSRAKLAQVGIEQQAMRLTDRKIRAGVSEARLARRATQWRDRAAGLPTTDLTSIRAREWQRLADAASIRTSVLNRELGLLEEKAGIARGSLSRAQLALREVAAAETDAARRGNVLRRSLSTNADRMAINTRLIKDHAKAVRLVRWDRLGAGGRIMQHFGRVAQYAGIVIGASFGYAAHQAAQFETQAQLVGTQMGRIGINAEQSMKLGRQLGQEILRVMPESTSSTQELADAAYDLFSSLDSAGKGFLTLKDGSRLLKLMAKAAIAGQTDIATATDGTISVMNAFGISVKEMPRVLNRLFAGVRFGRMTFAEFAKTLSVTAPAAKAAGQSLDTMVGTMAFLTRRLDVRKAAIGFARLTEILSRKKMVEGLKEAGVAVTDASGQFKQLPDIIEALVKKFPKLRKGGAFLAQFFKEMSGTEGTIQARRAFVFLAQQIDAYRDILGRTTRDNNEFNKSLRAMEQSTGVRWAKMVNQFKAFALMIGQAVIPQLLRLQPYIENIVKWFRNLDQSTKDMIGKWGAISAGLLLVGSAAAFLLGILIRLYATLGGRIGLFNSLLLVLIAISAAVDALSGNWDGLNGIIDRFVSFGTGSLGGWVVMLTAAAVAAIKLRNALLTTMVAFKGGAALAGAGGLAGMAASMGRVQRIGSKMFGMKMAAGIGPLRAGLAASAASIAAMGLSIPVVVGGIAAAAGGALLWKAHMAKVREEQDRIMAGYNRFMADSRRMTGAAQQLGGFGRAAREAKGAALDVKELKLQLQDLIRQRRGMEAGFARDMLNIQIERTKLNLADVQDRLRAIQTGATSGLTAMRRYIESYGGVSEQISRIQNEIARKQDQLARARGAAREDMVPGVSKSVDDVKRLQRQIEGLRGNLARLQSSQQGTYAVISQSFTRAVRDMQRAAMLPQKISADALRAATRFFAANAKRMTPKNLRVFFKAYLDPKSNIGGQIAAAAKKIREQDIKFKVKVEAAQKLLTFKEGQMQKMMPDLQANVKPDPAAQQKANQMWTVIDNITKKPHVTQVKPPPNLASIGASISSGIEAGMRPITQDVIRRVIHDPIGKAVETGSPSRWARREIGAMITKGIALGIIDEAPELEKAAALTANLFAGAWIQKLQEKIGEEADPLKIQELVAKANAAAVKAARKGATELDKIRARQAKAAAAKARPVKVVDLIKDTQQQAAQMKLFNDSLERLRRRGAPAALLDDLAELGLEGTRYIAMLASSTPREFRKFIAAWRQMEAQLKRSQRATVEGTKEWKEEQDRLLREAADDAAQRLLDMRNEFRDLRADQFGALFSNIDPRSFGEGFNEAMEEWRSNMGDLQNEMADLNKELADLYSEQAKLVADYNKEVAQIKADYIVEQVDKLKTAFGELFGGEYLQERREWAAALKFADIQRDLDEQLARFKNWREQLNALAARGLPPALLQELEALGPEAVDMLKILATGTDQELAQYIASWQEANAAFQSIAQQQALTSEELAQRLAEALNNFNEQMSSMTARIHDVLGKINDVAKQMRKLLEEQPKALTGQDIINAIQSQIAAWAEYESTLDALRARGLPEELILQLAKMGPEALPYLKALNTLTDEQLITGENSFVKLWEKSQKMIEESTDKLMKDQLQAWYAHGANMAAALIAGVSSQQNALLKFFRDLFINLLEGRYTNYQPPPAGTYTGPGTGGTSTGVGTGGGGGTLPGGVTVPGGWGIPSQSATGTRVFMTVNATQNETLDSTLARASFNLENRNVE